MQNKLKKVMNILLAILMVVVIMPVQFTKAETKELTNIDDFFSDYTDFVDVKKPEKGEASVVDRNGTKAIKLTMKGNTGDCIFEITFKKPAIMSFDYEVDADEKGGLEVKKGYWNYIYTYKDTHASKEKNINGKSKGRAEFGDKVGETVKVGYEQGWTSAPDKKSHCIYLTNIKFKNPTKVIFHSNNGEDKTVEQPLLDGKEKLYYYGKVGFKYDKHIQKGWSRTPEGGVDYKNEEIVEPTSDLDLYAVWAPVYLASFDIPKGTKLTLFRDEEHKEKIDADTGTMYNYTLEKGTYYYHIEGFGYKDLDDKIEIENQDITKTVVPEKTPKETVTFSLEKGKAPAEDVNISVTADNHKIEAKEGSEGKVFELPLGYKFRYTFKSKNYSKQSGEIDLSTKTEEGEREIVIPLNVKIAWDGAGDIKEPEEIDGVYQISSGAELAWFANKVNEKKDGMFNAVLTKDIDLGDEEWTPIGRKSGSIYPFRGIFDGNGKTIRGLKVVGDSKTPGQGLFGFVDGGKVKDLTVIGEVESKYNTTTDIYAATGGVIGHLSSNGTNFIVENCISYVNVKGKTHSGGIVGTVSGYRASGKISKCVNYGSISGTNSVGGILGQMDCSAKVTDCYNRGNATSSAWKVAGIVGYLEKGSVENCYTTGVTTGRDNHAVIGKKEKPSKTTNCYYLEGLIEDPEAKSISSSDLKEMKFESEISSFFKSTGDSLNDGYPVTEKQLKEAIPVLDQKAKEAAIKKAESDIEGLEAELNKEKGIFNSLKEVEKNAAVIVEKLEAKTANTEESKTALKTAKEEFMKIKENHKSAEDLLSTFEEDLSKLKAALEEIKSADSDEKVSAAVEKLHNENKKLSEKIAELNKINEAIKSSADKIAEASKAFEKAEKDFADKKNADKLPNDEADKVVYDKGISSVKGIKVKGNLKKKKLYISFKSDKKATNYRLGYQKAGSKKWTYVWLNKSEKKTVSKMENNGIYDVKLAKYINRDGKWSRSAWSTSRIFFASSSVGIKSDKKSFTAKIKVAEGTYGYIIRYSKKKNMSSAKTKTYRASELKKKKRVTIKKLKRKTTYYVVIRPIKKYSGRYYYGFDSSIKKFKTK